MSKLYENYKNLKSKEPNTIYLFKSGVFYLALEDDAKFLSEKFNFKLTNLNDTIVKCGFPCTSFDKYYIMFNDANLKFKIVEKENISDSSDYLKNNAIKEFFEDTSKIDIKNMSVSEAFAFVEKAIDLSEKMLNENN